jgi:hypothetical protein
MERRHERSQITPQGAGGEVMNRRNFLKGAVGLAAVAVTWPTLARLSRSDRERLADQIRTGGVIENQTFLLEGSGPVVIAVDNLTIRNCRFIWKKRATGYLMEIHGNNTALIGCTLDGRGGLDRAARMVAIA